MMIDKFGFFYLNFTCALLSSDLPGPFQFAYLLPSPLPNPFHLICKVREYKCEEGGGPFVILILEKMGRGKYLSWTPFSKVCPLKPFNRLSWIFLNSNISYNT